MTYLLKLQRTRNGETSVLFVDQYESTDSGVKVLVKGRWHELNNVKVVDSHSQDISEDSTLFNDEVLRMLEAE